MSESDYGDRAHTAERNLTSFNLTPCLSGNRDNVEEKHSCTTENGVSRLCAGCPPDIAWDLPNQNL